MNVSCETSVSLQEKLCLCFCFQDVSAANGTTELLHTEHIWYPRIREVKTSLVSRGLFVFLLGFRVVVPKKLQLLAPSPPFLFSC